MIAWNMTAQKARATVMEVSSSVGSSSAEYWEIRVNKVLINDKSSASIVSWDDGGIEKQVQKFLGVKVTADAQKEWASEATSDLQIVAREYAKVRTKTNGQWGNWAYMSDADFERWLNGPAPFMETQAAITKTIDADGVVTTTLLKIHGPSYDDEKGSTLFANDSDHVKEDQGISIYLDWREGEGDGDLVLYVDFEDLPEFSPNSKSVDIVWPVRHLYPPR
jgi:hypothetical protein